MSFFKELKEDIAQSVNELSESIDKQVVDTEGEAEDAGAFENEVRKEMESLFGDGSLTEDLPMPEEDTAEETEPEIPAAEETETEDSKEEEDKKDSEEMIFDMVDVQEDEEMSKKDNAKKTDETKKTEEVLIHDELDDEMINRDETTVITKGTTINGGIKSDTSLIVKGVIEGDVECQGKLTITGRVAGNSTASEIYVNTPKLQGNLASRGSVKVDVGTVVIGSIASASVVVAGAVKGDIDVNGPVIIDSTAVVQGSVYGKSIQINSGAVIDGLCSLKYADVDLESFFE